MKYINFKQLVFLLLIIGAYIVISQLRSNTDKNISSTTNTEQAFRNLPIKYSKHALCRMDCRSISEEEVENILRYGRIDPSRSDEEDLPCPTYALEGRTYDGQTVRMIFADCDEIVKVVTVIDLQKEYDCECQK